MRLWWRAHYLRERLGGVSCVASALLLFGALLASLRLAPEKMLAIALLACALGMPHSFTSFFVSDAHLRRCPRFGSRLLIDDFLPRPVRADRPLLPGHRLQNQGASAAKEVARRPYSAPGRNSLSRDTNRYVHGFDHFCEFVGNDIGKGNLGCFVTFLVLLSVLCTYVVVLSGWQVYLMLMPPGAEAAGGVAPGMPGLPPQSDLQPHWHLLLAPWRLLIAATVIGTLAYAIVKCTGSEVCAGVMPLIMMMPGATFGAVLIVLVFATVLLPLIDMWTDVAPSATRRPSSSSCRSSASACSSGECRPTGSFCSAPD